MTRRLPVAACAFTVAAASVANAIVFRNDMTDAQSAGLATQGQFSGVGKVAVAGEFGTGTLILSDWVLTAKHVVAGNATATFKGITGTVYADPDANSDVALIRLNTPASGAVISPGFLGGESGKLVWLVGVGGYGTVANSGNGGASLNYSGIPHAGTNVVREYSNPYLYFDNANTGATSSVYESSTAPGDSGGPMFQQINNAWYVIGETNGANGDGFTHTPTNPHQSFILNTIRTATGNSAFTFPTPTAPTVFNWDANPAATGTTDGSGTWDAQRPNFRNATTGYNYSWDNAIANDVTFGGGGGGGTVIIAATNLASGTKIDGTAGPTFAAGGVTAHNLTFGAQSFSGNYTVAAADAATLTLVNNGSTNPTITTTAGAEISAPIASTATITKAGSATLTLSGTNTYSGTMSVAAGTLAAKSAVALPGYETAGRLAVARNAVLSLYVGGAAGWTEAQVGAVLATPALANGSTLALDTTDGDFTFAGTVAGSVGLAKSGANTLTLTAAQAYTGMTTVNAGTLAVSGTGRLPNTIVTLGSGASLLIGSGVTQTVNTVLATNGATGFVRGPGTLNVSGGQLGGSNSTVDLTGLAALTGDNTGGLKVNGNTTVTRLPANTSLPYGLAVGTGDYLSITNTLTTVTLGGDTTAGAVQVGNYHASGVITATPSAAGKTLTLRGVGNTRVDVLVGVNSAGGQSQSGVFDTTGMVLDAYVGAMRLADYRPATGTATTTGTFTMTAGSLDAQSITLAYAAPTSVDGNAGSTVATFNQLGGTVRAAHLVLGQIANSSTYTVAQTVTYTLGDPATPATLVSDDISMGAVPTYSDHTTATRTINFVNGRITPSPGATLNVNAAYGNLDGNTPNQTLNIVLATAGTHALTAPAGSSILVQKSARIGGSGELTIDGEGSVSLSAINTYTGGTRVTNGTLYVYGSARAPLLFGKGLNLESGVVKFPYFPASNNPISTIRKLLAASYADNGFVNEKTIRSLTATAARGLAYFDNGFNEVTVSCRLYGDGDLDGGVSINDFNFMAGSFGVSSGATWTDGDFDYDGGVSINDFNLLAANFGQSLTAPAAAVDFSGLLAFAAAHNDLAAFEAVTGVPEPAAFVALAAGLPLLRRRKVS